MDRKTDKIQITTDAGERVDATVPVIISASRSTDIPAFYARWFVNRLRRGYCVWVNPFNRRQPMYVSFERCKVVVFWSKNPEPLLPYLDELDRRGLRYYFQFTLNDYEAERFEPNVPPLAHRVDTFRRLSERIGPERVIWRFDPMMLAPTLSVRELLDRVERIGGMLRGLTDKLVFSFVDVMAYRKVQANLRGEVACLSGCDMTEVEPNAAQRRQIAERLAALRDEWARDGWKIRLATCAEADDYASLGIEHNRCVDGELMEKLWGDDYELKYYLRTGKLPKKDMFYPQMPLERKDLKDKGQRKVCGCMVSKDIGMYDTCCHFCIYCYANASRMVVKQNKARHRDDGEGLVCG